MVYIGTKGQQRSMKQAIAYYRVSTNKQGKSGLGLEAQQLAVSNYCRLNELFIEGEITD
jgi:DNA invertase Pin-like site-specific DNA recombinase